MTDRTSEALRRTMQAVVDVAPEAPAVPADQLAPRARRRHPGLVAVGAFVIVLLTGITMALLTPSAPPADIASDPATTITTVAPTTWPPTTLGTSEVVYDTTAALAWRDFVVEAVALTGWEEPVIAAYETHLRFADGGTVTALVGETDWSRLIVDLQGWSDGEYRTDPAWQREVAGSIDPGGVTGGGTLFVRTGYANVVVLVNEHGLLTLQLVREEDETERLKGLAVALAPAMESLAEAG